MRAIAPLAFAVFLICPNLGSAQHVAAQPTIQSPGPDQTGHQRAPTPGASGLLRPDHYRGKVARVGRLITHDEAQHVVRCYRSIPGGFILEGEAKGLNVKSARYDAASDTFVLDDRIVYAPPVPAVTIALLARAIATDDRVGVSLAEETEIVYGRVPKRSQLALDLKLADNFLGDMILPPQEWTVGYRFADSYQPRTDVGSRPAAVLFRFGDFEFAAEGDKIRRSGVTFNAWVVPIIGKKANDGGYLPDFKAIEAGTGFEEHVVGARHVAEHINYYLQEKIVAQALAHGEAAAFLRALKAAGIDLRNLARSLEVPSALASRAPRTVDEGWLVYLRTIQSNNQYANWFSPPFDLYQSRKKHAGIRGGSIGSIARR